MKKILFVVFIGIIVWACSTPENTSSTDNFDRQAMLTNWADNLIIPSYTDYQSKVGTLQDAVVTFTTTANQTNLDAARTAWYAAYLAFQNVSQFNFGKAADIYLRDKTNLYPTDASGIDANISAGTYNLELISQYSKQGFPALDYLLYGLAGSDAAILEFYTTNTLATNYKTYLTDLVDALQTNIDLVVTDWNASYRSSYIANDGTSITGSVSITVNDYIYNFEKYIRSGKVAIPSGVFSNGITYPEQVEAYYRNDISKALYEQAIVAAENFFTGTHFNGTTNGLSLDDYLDELNAVRSGTALSETITSQFETIDTANLNLSASFSSQINTNNATMIGVYDALQLNLVYLKLDMMQALNLTIDYVDADGD
jgi:predicted lipoprotein